LHSADLNTFAEAYSDEVRGLIDLQGPAILKTVEFQAQKQRVAVPDEDENTRLQSVAPFKNAMVYALESDVKDARHIVRTLHIHASLHASVRWNKSRKLKPNDILDFHHAAAALGYCDAFFTERSLNNLVSQSHVALDKLYDCHVASSVNDALDYMATLAPA
jgi:hypothetical protein